MVEVTDGTNDDVLLDMGDVTTEVGDAVVVAVAEALLGLLGCLDGVLLDMRDVMIEVGEVVLVAVAEVSLWLVECVDTSTEFELVTEVVM